LAQGIEFPNKSDFCSEKEKKMHKFILWGLSVVLLSTTACREKKCKYKPTAIFEQGLPHVQQYNFEVQGQESMESLLLDTGTLLEIYQNICDESVQEYKFTVNGNFANFPDSLWLREASRQMVFLSSFSPRQTALKDWGDMIEQRRTEMRLGENREVQPGIFVKVDKVASAEKGILVLTLGQK
jgi:hypothetical protein